jgi:hypothetical protein
MTVGCAMLANDSGWNRVGYGGWNSKIKINLRMPIWNKKILFYVKIYFSSFFSSIALFLEH